jgi:hypothetical protein
MNHFQRGKRCFLAFVAFTAAGAIYSLLHGIDRQYPVTYWYTAIK